MAKKDEEALQQLMEVVTGAANQQQAARNPQEELQALTGTGPGQQAGPASVPWWQMNPGAKPWEILGQDYYTTTGSYDEGNLGASVIPGAWNPSMFGGAGASPTNPYGQYAITPYGASSINPEWRAAGGHMETTQLMDEDGNIQSFQTAGAPTQWHYNPESGWQEHFSSVGFAPYHQLDEVPLGPQPHFTDPSKEFLGGSVGEWVLPDHLGGPGGMGGIYGQQPDWETIFGATPDRYGEGFGTAEASRLQAISRILAEPLSAYIRETQGGKFAVDRTKEEGFQKRLGELGLQGITEDDPYGSGTIAAQIYGELAKQQQEAQLKAGDIDPSAGTFGGTLWAETEAAKQLEAEKRKATLGTGDYADIGQVAAQGKEERLSMGEKAKLARENMAEHARLLTQQGNTIKNSLAGVQAPFASMFGLNAFSPPGLGGSQQAGTQQAGTQQAGTSSMQNLFNLAGQGPMQAAAHKLLGGPAHGGQYNPFAASTAAVPGMVGGPGAAPGFGAGQHSLLGLQGVMNTQQAAQLGANQQLGKLGMQAGQNLMGQFNPQLANQFAIQAPFAQAAGSAIGGMGQTIGGVLGGMANVGAAV